MMGIGPLVSHLRPSTPSLENCGRSGSSKYLVVPESRGRTIVSRDGSSGIMEIQLCQVSVPGTCSITRSSSTPSPILSSPSCRVFLIIWWVRRRASFSTRSRLDGGKSPVGGAFGSRRCRCRQRKTCARGAIKSMHPVTAHKSDVGSTAAAQHFAQRTVARSVSGSCLFCCQASAPTGIRALCASSPVSPVGPMSALRCHKSPGDGEPPISKSTSRARGWTRARRSSTS